MPKRIPDDTELIAAELDDEGIQPNESLWIRFDNYRRRNGLRDRDLKESRATIEHLRSENENLRHRLNGDPCIGQMRLIDVDGDIRTYRCSKCHATQTSFGTAPVTCGARL